VKPGGRLVYATCSVFAEENEDSVDAFLARETGWTRAGDARRLSPASSGTDGFFVIALERR
jgi:16S rRNA (cytosine967-C5)-methyltransferase